MSQDHHLASLVERITIDLARKSAIRDAAITDGRQAIRHAANAVRALHREDVATAAARIADSGALVDAIVHRTAGDPDLYWAGYVQDAMKEYAEAAITAAVLDGSPIPAHDTLGVEATAWLAALAEAGSELRRDVLDALRAGNLDRAEDLLATMDDIYRVLVTVDFPDAMTGGLRRATDQFRAVLERTRGDVTVTAQQRRLEAAIRDLDARLATRKDRE